MKRNNLLIKLCVISVIMILCTTSTVIAANDIPFVVHNTDNAESLFITYDGETVDFKNNAPILNEDKTALVSVRTVAEMLGANVVWDESSKTVYINADDSTIIFNVDSDRMFKNDDEYLMDNTTQLINECVYVPINYLCEAFNKLVWYIPGDDEISPELLEIKSEPSPLTAEEFAYQVYAEGWMLEDERDGWFSNIVKEENIFRGHIPLNIKTSIDKRNPVPTKAKGFTQLQVSNQEYMCDYDEQALDVSDNDIEFIFSNEDRYYSYETLPITNHSGSVVIDYAPSENRLNPTKAEGVIYLMAYDRKTKKRPFMVGHMWFRYGERTVAEIGGLREDRDYLFMIENDNLFVKDHATLKVYGNNK